MLIHLLWISVGVGQLVLNPHSVISETQVGTTTSDGFGVFGLSGNYDHVSLANLGDINGDGLDDAIFGETGHSGNRGRAIILFGNSSGLPVMETLTTVAAPYGFEVTWANGDADAFFGASFGGGGDYNGDGINDILIGSFGRVALIWGKSNNTFSDSIDATSLDPTDGIIITTTSGEFGYTLDHIGDFNGDLYDDFAVGDSGNSDDGSWGGATHIFFGRASSDPWSSFTADSSNSFMFTSGTDWSHVGSQVAGLGDVNNDSMSDMAFFISGYTSTSQVGRVVVVFGNEEYGSAGSMGVDGWISNDTVGFTIDGVVVEQAFGRDIEGGCDFNHDGILDIMIGSNENKGAIVYGKPSGHDVPLDLNDLDGSLGFLITGDFEAPGKYLGCLGDIDGDSYDDFFITAFNGEFQVDSSIIFGHEDPFQDIDMKSLTADKYRNIQVTDMARAIDLGNFRGDDTISIMINTVTEDTKITNLVGLDELPTPIITESPTTAPTSSPSSSPTASPTSPTQSPTTSPSLAPTIFVTDMPSTSPTAAPSVNPTTSPSNFPSSSPTFSPTNSPTVSPTTSPTSSPTVEVCDVVITTTGGEGLSWEITDAEGDEEIDAGDFGDFNTSVTLLASEDYLLFLSDDTFPEDSSISISVNGEQPTTIDLSGVAISTEMAGLTCEEIVNKIEEVEDSAYFNTGFILLCALLVLW